MFPIKDAEFPVLGEEGLAEKLVEWSLRTEKGKDNLKSTIWGLGVVLTANEDQPYYDILIEQPGLKEFIKNLGPTAQGILRCYGITLALSSTDVAIYISQDEKNVIPLFQSPLETLEDEPHSYLGRVFLGEQGPVFYSAEEVNNHNETETVTPQTETLTEEDNLPVDLIPMEELEKILLNAVE